MKGHHIWLSALALLAACNTNTQIKTAIQEDRQGALARCIRAIDLAGPGVKSQFKNLTGASDQRLSAVVCDRLLRAVESGRLTFTDIDRMQRGHGSELIKVLKGR